MGRDNEDSCLNNFSHLDAEDKKPGRRFLNNSQSAEK